MLNIDAQKVSTGIADFIRSSVGSANALGVVIGLSGGIDSTVTAYLSVKGLGSDKVLGVMMPESGRTPPEDILDAQEVAERLNIEFRIVEISDMLRSFSIFIPGYDASNRIAAGNLKARVRMCALYYYANAYSRLVVGTGNKTELLLGYFTKYGDGGVDIEPLGCLYKTGVRELARYLDVPKSIIDKVPSAGFWPGQTDEGELGISYDMADRILSKYEAERLDAKSISLSLGIPLDMVASVLGRVETNKHKRAVPPIPQLF